MNAVEMTAYLATAARDAPLTVASIRRDGVAAFTACIRQGGTPMEACAAALAAAEVACVFSRSALGRLDPVR